DYFRRMFFRHGRYFIMAFVAHRAADVLNRPELQLSEADRTTISRLTNELSEMIYAATEPLQGLKGYLAIFPNLTDAQPLADKIITQLAAQDQAEQPNTQPSHTAAAAVQQGNAT